ncbi:MAG: amidase [Actinomycetota bacterium]
MKPPGSQGLAAIDAACRAVRSHEVLWQERPPAYCYSLPGGPPDLGSANGAPAGLPGRIGKAIERLRRGEVSSAELVDDALATVRRLNPALNALSHVEFDSSIVEAQNCDREAGSGRWRGPLHGIPLTVKDVIDVAGMPTRAGSAAFERVPIADADSVNLLRKAGAVIIGKATTHEFALGVTSPQSRNPFDQTRIPGGSSGGSAIAVATGMGLASLGTDTRASIRVPAALCGTVGFKPTFGSIPTRGIVPLSWTMDHISPMAATVADAALLFDVLAPGRHLAGHAGSAVKGMRIGIPGSTFEGTEPQIAALVEETLASFDQLGIRRSCASRPDAADLELANAAGMLISRCEAAAYHRNLGLDRSLYWDEVADQLAAAGTVVAMDYIDAQRIRAELAHRMTGAFETCDVLAMPTVPVVAPAVEDFSRYLLTLSRNAIPWSLTGLPAVSVPCGTVDGLPVGLQLVAAPWREDLLVALGSALESLLASE